MSRRFYSLPYPVTPFTPSTDKSFRRHFFCFPADEKAGKKAVDGGDMLFATVLGVGLRALKNI